MFTVMPQDIMSARTEGGWEDVEFYVDSGAPETAIHEDMFLSISFREGQAKEERSTRWRMEFASQTSAEVFPLE